MGFHDAGLIGVPCAQRFLIATQSQHLILAQGGCLATDTDTSIAFGLETVSIMGKDGLCKCRRVEGSKCGTIVPTITDVNMAMQCVGQRMMTPLGTLDGVILNHYEGIGCRRFVIVFQGYKPMSLAIRLHRKCMSAMHIIHCTECNMDILAPLSIIL